MATTTAPITNKALQAVREFLDPDFLKKIEQLNLVSRKVFAGRMKGERRSKKRGISNEFADYRDYSPGDDLRFIDWNIYGRLDRLFLKLFMEEEDLHVYLLIDGSESMTFGNPSKFDYARKICAALGYIGLVNLDRVGVGLFSTGVRELLPPTRSKKQAWRLFEFLATLKPDGGTSLAESCKQYAIRHPNKGILILCSDFLDPAGYESALKFFIQQKYEIFVMHILAEEEVHPGVEGHLRLVDCESGQPVEITVSPELMKAYQATLDNFVDNLRRFCTSHGICYVNASTTFPFDRLVLEYLRRMGLIK